MLCFVQVMTPSMTGMLMKRWASYTRCLTGFFTVLMVACAYCGSCTFNNDPRGGMKFVKVAAEGREREEGGVNIWYCYKWIKVIVNSEVNGIM